MIPAASHGHEGGEYRDKIDKQPCTVGADKLDPIVPAEIGDQLWKQGKVYNTGDKGCIDGRGCLDGYIEPCVENADAGNR